MLLAVALVFVGNHAFSDDELVAAMAPDGQVFDTSAPIDSDPFQLGLLRLSSFYADHGYVTARISDPDVHGDDVAITIEEGSKFTISSVTLTGDYFGDPGTYLSRMAIHPKALFSAAAVRGEAARIRDSYYDRGFAYATVMPWTHVDVARSTISIELEVQRGERAYIEAIDVAAPTRELADRIRRALPMAIGDMFTNADLDETRRRTARIAGVEATIAVKRGSTPTDVQLMIEIPDQ